MVYGKDRPSQKTADAVNKAKKGRRRSRTSNRVIEKPQLRRYRRKYLHPAYLEIDVTGFTKKHLNQETVEGAIQALRSRESSYIKAEAKKRDISIDAFYDLKYFVQFNLKTPPIKGKLRPTIVYVYKYHQNMRFKVTLHIA